MRKPVVVRTKKYHVYAVKSINRETEEINITSIKLPRKKAENAVKKQFESDNPDNLVLSVEYTGEKKVVYEMDEEFYIQNARVISEDAAEEVSDTKSKAKNKR